MTYRLAVLSDVHADLYALRDALRQIDAMGCDAIVCAGDTVDYGLFPNETIALLAQRAIPTVRGNHDRWGISSSKSSAGGEWALTKASWRFLAGTLRSWSLEREGSIVEVHHARPGSDMDGIIPPNAPRHRLELDVAVGPPPINASALLRNADVLIVGHTHLPFAMRFGLRYIVNPGALLRDPAGGADNPPATGTFGVLELPERRWRVFRAKDGAEVDILRAP
jgi:predicted phosphodiesterase